MLFFFGSEFQRYSYSLNICYVPLNPPSLHGIHRMRQNILVVTPKIAPFDFGEEPSNYADSASVQCLVTSGDLPIEFKWLFNGRPVIEYSGITTAKMGKRNSVLTIDSVSGKHAGNFTCQASNSAASAQFTSQLIVNGVHVITIT